MRIQHSTKAPSGSTYMIEQTLNPDPYLRHLRACFRQRMCNRTTHIYGNMPRHMC
jgi:hypothetical protein